jgi:peptidoglycan/xylan/chitin deacetylase (PgdA/CDA1 family)
LPDVQAYSLRDYGSRVGVFRMMDVFDKHGIRASVLLNAEVCDRHPKIIEEGKKRNWEWLGHGLTNNSVLSSYPPEKQGEVIREVKDRIAAAVGKAPKGWLGPGLDETFDTPDHLAAAGFEYLCDWSHDDQPVPMRVRSGRMITLPYSQGINDFPVFVQGNHTPQEYFQMVCDQFDTLYAEGAKSGRVMAIPLHPFITGLPFRIKYLDKALEYIVAHDDVWRATGWEIAEWYYQNYYKAPQ